MADLPAAFANDWQRCALGVHDAGWQVATARQLRHGGRDRWTFYAVTEGRHRVRTPLGCFALAAPAAYLVPPRLVIEDDPAEERTHRRVLTVGFAVLVPPGWSDPLLTLVAPAPVPVRDAVAFAAAVGDLLATMERGRPRDGDHAILARIALDRILLAHLRDGFAAGVYRPLGDAGCPAWLRQLAGTMIHRYQQRAFSVADLATAAGVSPPHLTRLFRRHLGISPLRHLRRERVRLGLRLLANASAGSVAEAAARVGYGDPRLFWRHCVAETGRPPSTARPGAR